MDGVYGHDDRHLTTIREQARLLGRVVDDLRTISLADTGALPLSLGDIRLGEVIASVAVAFAAKAEARGVALVAAPAAGPDVVVMADRDRLAQAVATMVDNAIRFASPGGGVEIRGSTTGPMTARIEVIDDGPGVPPADIDRVFDRLYQADVSRDRASGTSGLGLAIARAIAEAHRGRVGVENRVGGGATFWIEVPRAVG
jgi:two-component system sensor histidine kinase BaeS